MSLLVLPHAVTSAAVARGHVRDVLRRRGVADDRCDDAALVVSELVTNAVRHGRPRRDGTILLRWRLDGDRLHVEASDGGGDTVPRVQRTRPGAVSGRGLAIVNLLALDWGTRSDDGGCTVWSVLPAPAVTGADREDLQPAG